MLPDKNWMMSEFIRKLYGFLNSPLNPMDRTQLRGLKNMVVDCEEKKLTPEIRKHIDELNVENFVRVAIKAEIGKILTQGASRKATLKPEIKKATNAKRVSKKPHKDFPIKIASSH